MAQFGKQKSSRHKVMLGALTAAGSIAVAGLLGPAVVANAAPTTGAGIEPATELIIPTRGGGAFANGDAGGAFSRGDAGGGYATGSAGGAFSRDAAGGAFLTGNAGGAWFKEFRDSEEFQAACDAAEASNGFRPIGCAS